MVYPKAIMSITEMVALGFSREYMRNIVHVQGQQFATPSLGGGKWQIDTAEFEKFRKKERERAGRVAHRR